MKLDANTDSIVDCICSLQNSLQNAGGIVNKDIEYLQKISAYDLIHLIAPNGIRFVFKRDKVLGGEKF